MENYQDKGTSGMECGMGWKKHKCCSKGMCGGYGLAVIGAAIYYIQNADTFWMGVLGILKAIVWPAFLIYKLLGL